VLKPVLERFLLKINVVDSGCWEWTGNLCRNYAHLRKGTKILSAHRFIYEYYHGEIDHNLVIDHLCSNTKCVNPLHLKQVTQQENVLRSNGLAAIHARKTYCIRGHKFTPENTYIRPSGGRRCRMCDMSRYNHNRHLSQSISPHISIGYHNQS